MAVCGTGDITGVATRQSFPPMNPDDATPPANEPPFELPLDGVLDLHGFRPPDVKEVVLEYLAGCQAHGICEVRLIHGQGIGALKRTVHALLARHPEVVEFHLDHPLFGGAGATCVRLRNSGAIGRRPGGSPLRSPE